MREKLMERLRLVTQEEQRLLEGGQVERERYSGKPLGPEVLAVDSQRLLDHGELITLRTHTRFAAFPAHTHNYVEIMYMCSGQTVHWVNGGPPLTLRAGELLFLNQHAVHQVERAGAEDVGVNFIVLPQFFDYALELIGTHTVLGNFLLSGLRQQGGGISFLHFQVAGVPAVQNLVENLVESLAFPQPGTRRLNQATMGVLFLQLLHCTQSLAQEGPAQAEGPVLSALREIEENYRSADLSRVARQEHLSLSALSSAVHLATGRTFKELLLEKRLSKGAELLRDTGLPVEDIIAAVGYENTSYFYRKFRERYGVSPRDYRRSHRERS